MINNKQIKVYSPGCMHNNCYFAYTKGTTAPFIWYFPYTQGNTASFVCYFPFTYGNAASFEALFHWCMENNKQMEL
jgi:hypothetical protein